MISSLSNEKIKLVRSLKERKYRDKLSLFLVEGVKSVFEASEKAEICFVLVTPLLEEQAPKNCEVLVVTDKVFASVTDETTPQGMLAVVKKPQQKKCDKFLGKGLLLDRVRDPGNLGTIIRTAVATGFRSIFLIDTVDPYAPKVVRASMGGIFSVEFYFVTPSQVKDLGVNVISADINGENIFEFVPPSSYLLAIGNEGAGLSDEIVNLSTSTVCLPMEKGIESLNAGVSAGVLMYLLRYGKNC